MARYLGKYIQGSPTFVVENMPGASGIKATNYLYEAAPKDGTVIATVNNSMPVYQAIDQPGVRFQAEDLNWIGSLLQTAPPFRSGIRRASRRSRKPSTRKSSWAQPAPRNQGGLPGAAQQHDRHQVQDRHRL